MVRGFAAKGLGDIGPDANDALPALVKVWTDDDDEVIREAAHKAICEIRGLPYHPS